jgi:predicted DCC family thiol-disulfide oxidoreductase YuxK
VDFVMARDKSSRYRFAPLQGETAASVLKRPAGSAATGPVPDDVEGLKSVVLWDADGLHRKSKAALRVIASLGGLWSLAILFLIFPAFLRDLVYDFIARNRYRWFGKKESCRMPTPAERARFLP